MKKLGDEGGIRGRVEESEMERSMEIRFSERVSVVEGCIMKFGGGEASK